MMADGEGSYATEPFGEGRMVGLMSSRGTVTAANHDSTCGAPKWGSGNLRNQGSEGKQRRKLYGVVPVVPGWRLRTRSYIR